MFRSSSERLTGLIVGFGFVGVLLTSWLVASEIVLGSTCPMLLGIPACYLVLAGYASATIGAWVFGRRPAAALFYAGTGAVTLIGIYFSIGELQGTVECPSLEGLPMCYMSFFSGTSMLILSEFRRRHSNRGSPTSD